MIRVLLLLATLGALGCTYRSGPTQPPVPEVKSVTVGPPNAALAVGQTTQLTATAYDAHGEVVTGLTVTWSSADPTIASVDSNGMARGIGAGQAHISASVASATGTLTVTVAP